MESMEKVDLPMHTAEHILNQTMVRLLGTERCFSAHIEKKKSKCDYHFDRALTVEEIKRIEDQVNDIISADLPVREEIIPLAEAQNNYKLKFTPNENDNTVRMIRIGEYDAAPCLGPHVSSTREVGVFRIISSDWNEGVLRIRYKLFT